MPLRTIDTIRKRFKIKGHEWRVRYKRNLYDEEFGPCKGLCEPDERVIYIEAKLSAEDKWKTFKHELWHAIEAELHVTIDDTTSEILADGVSDILDTLFIFEWRNFRRTREQVAALKAKSKKKPSVDATEVSLEEIV
jgi:hypothetical protein